MDKEKIEQIIQQAEELYENMNDWLDKYLQDFELDEGFLLLEEWAKKNGLTREQAIEFLRSGDNSYDAEKLDDGE
ncbi:MAG: hypothetical protein KatS3mg096_721 [Candidatus Parcubacteria bacterium]|nr:MAG: hypothetical protein KatS3mg096_721 [Candidatus Parcubacteria bacterium]